MKYDFSASAKHQLEECFLQVKNQRKAETVDPEKLSKLQKIPQEFIAELVKIKGALSKEP